METNEKLPVGMRVVGAFWQTETQQKILQGYHTAITNVCTTIKEGDPREMGELSGRVVIEIALAVLGSEALVSKLKDTSKLGSAVTKSTKALGALDESKDIIKVEQTGVKALTVEGEVADIITDAEKGMDIIQTSYAQSSEIVKAVEGGRAAGGVRQSAFKELNAEEILYIKNEFAEIGGDPSKLRFNKGSSTSYRDDIDMINIRGDVFADISEIHPRSVMSERAVLAHEYYGHAAYRGTTAKIGSWNDEFRASYMAAKNAPNLSDIDRYHLIQDAITRAQEAGVTIKPNNFMRSILYGY